MGSLTLTNLLPTAFEALDVVSREMVGMIPAVSRDSNAARAAIGTFVTSPVVGAMAAEDLTPAAYAADTPNQTIDNVQVGITKSRSVPFGITGEETLALNNAGTLGNINRDRLAQAFRTLCNEVEADLCALHKYASRAYGTAAGTPFATAGDLSDFANPYKILTDNGAPASGRRMVLASSHATNIRGKQSTLFQVNTAGSDALLRLGALGVVENFVVGESAQIATSVAGTAASATTNNAGYAVGSTTFTLASAGTGTLVAGDIITFAGDTNQYLVVSGDTDVSNGGTLVIAEPGIRVAMSAATKAITVVAATKRSMFFHPSAIVLATRAPAMPDGGDSADDVMMITDPRTGLTFELCLYRQKRQVRYEVNLAWGVKMVAPRHAGVLIGA